MELIKGNAFRLSRTGRATQIVLLCHGGWDLSDGYTLVPKGMVLHFYCGHGYTNGGTVCTKAILEAQGRARGGLVQSFEDAYPTFRTAPDEKDPVFRDWEKLMLAAKADFNSSGMGRVMVVDTVGNDDMRVQIYNYLLSFWGPDDQVRLGDEEMFERHQNGEYGDDVDMMMMQKDCIRNRFGMARTRHLANAIEFAREHNGGENYAVFHYAPCRYMEQELQDQYFS